MFYPVRVYKQHPKAGGKVKRVISSKALSLRADLMGNFGVSEGKPNKPVKIRVCETCKNNFPLKPLGGRKYCSPECGAAMKKKQDLEGKRRRALEQKKKGGEK